MKFKRIVEAIPILCRELSDAAKDSWRYTSGRFKEISIEPKPIVKTARNKIAGYLVWLAERIR